MRIFLVLFQNHRENRDSEVKKRVISCVFTKLLKISEIRKYFPQIFSGKASKWSDNFNVLLNSNPEMKISQGKLFASYSVITVLKELRSQAFCLFLCGMEH